MKIDHLIERVNRGIVQCDSIQQQACIIEQDLEKLNESIQIFIRLIEISCLLLISTDKEKLSWLKLTNYQIKEFISRLEFYLRRKLDDKNERQAYIQALILLQTSEFFS